MKNLPKKIYLQLGEFIDDADFLDTDFGDLAGVTWADSDIDEYDQEYIHEDEVNRLTSLVQSQKELILQLQLTSRDLTLEEMDVWVELKNKIKQLES